MSLKTHSCTAYFIFKGVLLLILALVTWANGGIDLLSHQPSSIDCGTVAALGLASLLLCAPLFYALESLK